MVFANLFDEWHHRPVNAQRTLVVVIVLENENDHDHVYDKLPISALGRAHGADLAK